MLKTAYFECMSVQEPTLEQYSYVVEQTKWIIHYEEVDDKNFAGKQGA